MVGDFDRHVAELPKGGRRLLAFLGGTVGNYPPQPRARLLASMAATLEPGETLQEAEQELGLADWVDADTGELAAQNGTRIEDH